MTSHLDDETIQSDYSIHRESTLYSRGRRRRRQRGQVKTQLDYKV